MAPRAYWKGSLKLSLVTCPIALFPASTQAEKTYFHQINIQSGNRLRQQMVDEQTGRVVDPEHKGRGYELSKGKYVAIEDEELDALRLESTHTIEIDDFVPAEEIDERYLDKPYYIVPNGKAGVDASVVIRDAMKREDKVALARVVLANREHVIALKPPGQGIVGNHPSLSLRVKGESNVINLMDALKQSLSGKKAATAPVKSKKRTSKRLSRKRKVA
jgi:DNA end-binding protein Ku